MATILNLAILNLAILVFPLKFTHTCQDWFPPFAQKNFTHSFWLNLMMAAFLNLAILDSAILVFPLKITHTGQDWLPPFPQKKTSLTLPLKFRIWLKLIQSDSNSFILAQLHDSSHLEFCHLGFSYFAQKTSLIYSDSTWWWQPSWILPSWIWPILDSAILVFPLKLTHACQDWFPPFAQKKTNNLTSLPHYLQKKLLSFILTQLNDGSHLEFGNVGFSHCHLGFRHLVISLRFTPKHSNSILTLTQTNSIWLKLISFSLNLMMAAILNLAI